MNYDKYSEEEITEIVEHIQENMENPVQYIDNAYDEIMFLGIASKRMKGELLESTLFMSKVCINFYVSIEEYDKANNLKRIFDILIDDMESLYEIDETILTAIEICLN